MNEKSFQSQKRNSLPILQALGAAVLFGASAPLSKLLLRELDPVPLAALLYLGSGMVALLVILLQYGLNLRSDHHPPIEAPISRNDLPWLTGAIFAGGVMAPIILLFSLQVTQASTASLLLNFEIVATTFLAATFFKESTGQRVWVSMTAITLGAILLSWEGSDWGLSMGALGVLLACILWGLDNNFTRNISSKDPLSIVAIKGFGAGLFSLAISQILGNRLPGLGKVVEAMILGGLSYGVSIMLFIRAMRSLGAARTSTLFGTAPFMGALLSLVIFREIPGVIFFLAFLIMVFGTYWLVNERHNHAHQHFPQVHDHRHFHDDLHHEHSHQDLETAKEHAHSHTHGSLTHTHPHTPDIHHRHTHSD